MELLEISQLKAPWVKDLVCDDSDFKPILILVDVDDLSSEVIFLEIICYTTHTKHFFQFLSNFPRVISRDGVCFFC
jgi:hypothetical protein